MTGKDFRQSTLKRARAFSNRSRAIDWAVATSQWGGGGGGGGRCEPSASCGDMESPPAESSGLFYYEDFAHLPSHRRSTEEGQGAGPTPPKQARRAPRDGQERQDVRVLLTLRRKSMQASKGAVKSDAVEEVLRRETQDKLKAQLAQAVKEEKLSHSQTALVLPEEQDGDERADTDDQAGDGLGASREAGSNPGRKTRISEPRPAGPSDGCCEPRT